MPSTVAIHIKTNIYSSIKLTGKKKLYWIYNWGLCCLKQVTILQYLNCLIYKLEILLISKCYWNNHCVNLSKILRNTRNKAQLSYYSSPKHIKKFYRLIREIETTSVLVWSKDRNVQFTEDNINILCGQPR